MALLILGKNLSLAWVVIYQNFSVFEIKFTL